MAYNGKTVKIDGIVEKAFRDSGLHEVDWESAIEWTVDLLGLLGVSATKTSIVTNGEGDNPDPILVEENRGRLPDNLESLTSVRRVELNDDGTVSKYIPMIEATDVYHTSDADMNVSYPTEFGSEFRLTSINEDGEAEDDTIEVNQEKRASRTFYTYKLDGQFIFSDFEMGYIEVAYEGFPLDDRGLPLVPDDPKFLQALKYHIIFRCDWINWRANPASPGLKAVVNDSEQRRDFYVAAARNKAHIPNLDEMEAIKNQWIRSIPKINEHANGFKTLGTQEQRYNQYSNSNIRRRR